MDEANEQRNGQERERSKARHGDGGSLHCDTFTSKPSFPKEALSINDEFG